MSPHFKPNNSLCRYQQKREEAIQSARRQYLYDKLSNEQREAIDDQVDSSTYSFDDDLEEFVVNKECEVAADIRALLREGIHPALILCAFEAGNCTVEFPPAVSRQTRKGCWTCFSVKTNSGQWTAMSISRRTRLRPSTMRTSIFRRPWRRREARLPASSRF
jgi:hypothetical protein